MLDQSINTKSLSFAISGNERLKYSNEFSVDDSNVIRQCIDFYNADTDFPLLKSKKIYGKDVYDLNDVVSDVLLKRLNLTLKTINSARQDNRSKIIKAIKSLLREKNPYSILRLDIKRFYESIDLNYVVNKICSDSAYSISTQYLLKKWQKCFMNSNVEGLPRGLSLSATLSEYFMKPFDKKAKGIDGVFFYARFVDDIIIFTTAPPEATFSMLEDILPKSLEFGKKKSKKQLITIPKYTRNAGDILTVDYLGYSFVVEDSNKSRVVKIDLSKAKRDKIKTRIIKAILSFNKSGDFRLLEKRIRFLSSNFFLFNKYRSTTVRSGIYYNYPYITNSHDVSCGLKELDDFLNSILFCKKLSHKMLGKDNGLTSSQKKALAKCSFTVGHNNKIFHRFTPQQMKQIKRCWSF